MADVSVERLRELHEQATPAPWAWEPHGDSGGWSLGVVFDEHDRPLTGRLEPGEGDIVAAGIADKGVDGTDTDAALIVTARNLLPDLLAFYDAARDASAILHAVLPHGLGQRSHTRTSTSAGPDYCAECSEMTQEWQPWPCGAVRLRAVLARLDGASDG